MPSWVSVLLRPVNSPTCGRGETRVDYACSVWSADVLLPETDDQSSTPARPVETAPLSAARVAN